MIRRLTFFISFFGLYIILLLTLPGPELQAQGLIFTDCPRETVGGQIGICAYDPAKPGKAPVISYPEARGGVISRSGQRVLNTGGESDKLYLSDLSGANPKFVTQVSGRILRYDLSYDERYVAYTSQGPDDDPYANSLVIVNVDTGLRTVVVSQTQVEGAIARFKWSPDGTRIAFTDIGWRAFPDGVNYHISSIRVVAVAGGNPINISNGGLSAPPMDYRYQDVIWDWSPDGAQLLFERNRFSFQLQPPPPEPRRGLWVVSSTSAALPNTLQGTMLFVPEGERGGTEAVWAPNGRQIAYYTPPVNAHLGEFSPVFVASVIDSQGVEVISKGVEVISTGVRTLRAWVGGTDELVVNSVSDRPASNPNNGMCDTGEVVLRSGSSEPECTLRAAIEVANARSDPDSVSVDIPGTGTHTITIKSALPALSSPLVIDATTQPGYYGHPLITINGMDGIENGFVLAYGESVVRGFSIGGFTNAGILISGAGENIIEANHIGISAAGTTAILNRSGIIIENSSENRIGGPEPAQMNVISGNTDTRPGIKMQDERTGIGILIQGTGATGNVIQGNKVGTDHAGQQAIGNGYVGVLIYDASENLIGGDKDSYGNVISANESSNVLILGPNANENIVSGNIIGTNVDGTVSLSENAGGIWILFGAETASAGQRARPARRPAT